MAQYNNWELVKRILMNTTYGYNREVYKHFKDIIGQGEITTSMRHAFRDACFINLKDSAVVALHKRLLFYFEVLGLHRQQNLGDFQEQIRTYRRGKPQVVLYFWNDARDIKELVRGRISFRIMSDSFNTETESDALQIAQKIKTKFGGSSPFEWRKGKNLYSYSDWDKGYQFQILATTEGEAKRLINAVLDLQNHNPEWKYFNTILNDSPTEAFPQNRIKKRVLGDLEETPLHRPIELVKFKYATISVPPFKPKVLYSTFSL